MTAAAPTQAVPQALARDRNRLAARYDVWLIATTLVLLVLGLVMVASASIATGDRQLGQPLYYFWRQAAYVTAGVLMGFAALRVPLVVWRRAGAVLLAFGVVLLVLALVPVFFMLMMRFRSHSTKSWIVAS